MFNRPSYSLLYCVRETPVLSLPSEGSLYLKRKINNKKYTKFPRNVTNNINIPSFH